MSICLTTRIKQLYNFTAPIDDYTKYRVALAHAKKINSTEGTNVMLSYEMNYYSIFSLAEFCFFPKGSYNLVFNFLDFNDSTCCVCKATDCEDCDDANWTISATKNSNTYSFVLHLKDVSILDHGIYTMTACTFQINEDTCGPPAWTEIEVHPPSNSTHYDHDTNEWWKYYLIFGIPGLVIVILTPFLIFCCYWYLCKRKCQGKEMMQPFANFVY